MNVKQLIAKLQEVPSHAEVYVGGDTSWRDGVDKAAEADSRCYSVEDIIYGEDGCGKVVASIGGRLLSFTRICRLRDEPEP